MLAWAALFFYFYAMAKTREVFICSACGAQTLQWRGQCPGCHEWNTLQAAAQPKALSRSNTRVSVPAGNRPVPLQNVAETGHHPYPSGIASLDRVLGKGLVPGAAILIGGEPGIGKSTLLLQVAGLVAAQGGRVLYASGEESLPQIKARGQRLGMLHDNLLAMSTSSVDEVIAALELAPPRLLVVDSVQTMSSVDAEGLPGNVNQVRAVSMALLEACRRLGVTLVLVGHVTKDGVLAGPRLLEHMVDTVISLEGDRRQMFRLLRVFKNPIVLGILIGSAWSFTGIKLPDFLEKSVELVAMSTTPMCLMVVGMGLAQHSFRAALTKGSAITAVKLVLQPLLVWIIAKMLGLGTLETNAVVLMASLPVAINIYLMAQDFKAEEGAASNSIFVSTFLSALTVPLTLTLLGAAPQF